MIEDYSQDTCHITLSLKSTQIKLLITFSSKTARHENLLATVNRALEE